MSDRLEFFDGKSGRMNVPKIVIAEGYDDAVFLNQVLIAIEADPKTIGVCYTDGHGNLEPFCRSIALSPSFTQGVINAVAIVRDADDDYASTVRLSARYFAAFNAPSPPDGATADHEGRKYGLFLYPDASSVGTLEDLLIQAAAFTAQKELADAFVQEAVTLDGNLGSLPKRKMQSYLAASPIQLCAAAGRGLRNGAFAIDHQSLDRFKAFLRAFVS